MRPLRDIFDVPDLAVTDDAIVNGTYHPAPGAPLPLAPFTASRVDYSLHRLPHYTATSPEFFQNFVIFTNYQFYIDEFIAYSRANGGARRGRLRQLRRAGERDHAGWKRTAGLGNSGVAAAADAGLPPDHAGPCRADHGQYRRRSIQREDHHRPHRRAPPACLADARPLRRPSQHPGARRLRARPWLCPRGPRARRRPADLGPDPAARRGPDRARAGGRGGDRASPGSS